MRELLVGLSKSYGRHSVGDGVRGPADLRLLRRSMCCPGNTHSDHANSTNASLSRFAVGACAGLFSLENALARPNYGARRRTGQDRAAT